MDVKIIFHPHKYVEYSSGSSRGTVAVGGASTTLQFSHATQHYVGIHSRTKRNLNVVFLEIVQFRANFITAKNILFSKELNKLLIFFPTTLVSSNLLWS